MTNTDLLRTQLHGKGFRITPQRRAILQVLQDAKDHLAVSEIFDRALIHLPGLTEATVYRTLEFLAEQGLAFPTQMADGRMAYEIAAHEHHHLLCRGCGYTVEIDHKELQQMYRHLEKISNFRLMGSHLTFIGLCADCK